MLELYIMSDRLGTWHPARELQPAEKLGSFVLNLPTAMFIRAAQSNQAETLVIIEQAHNKAALKKFLYEQWECFNCIPVSDKLATRHPGSLLPPTKILYSIYKKCYFAHCGLIRTAQSDQAWNSAMKWTSSQQNCFSEISVWIAKVFHLCFSEW